MRRRNALAFQLPSEVLAAYYTVWQQCNAQGHSPVIVEKKARLAAEARGLLQAEEAPGGPRPDEEMRQFRRFCRLFLARGGEQFPPFYDLFAQFWAGQDIVQVLADRLRSSTSCLSRSSQAFPLSPGCWRPRCHATA